MPPVLAFAMPLPALIFSFQAAVEAALAAIFSRRLIQMPFRWVLRMSICTLPLCRRHFA